MMKAGAATALAVIAWVALTIAPFGAAHAAGMYVRDWITITVRAEPDDNAKIIDVAKSNDYLEVLSERGDWTRVRSGKGKDGWVVSRYLTKQTPKTLAADRLKEQVKKLTEQVGTLKEENRKLSKENKSLSSSDELQALRHEYERLQEESGEYVKLKERNEELENIFKENSARIEQLTRENNRMKTSERLVFILLGGGFIGVGLVLGGTLQALRGRPKKAGYKF